ncbi:uncharacterized protein E5676_scaffold863G001230 [Cucumis melo var. makuwa]|uniref:Uncharacterized protein n=1 Tax=Cucumis melo var. makuwa TaxID=1194695 RepID=A0A5D3BXC1_CUCMM|nr:uncharacterized protein E6C27_scaffold511G001070 [Cucumis melo var. makuwa]TYK03745.1 uncharacterized protein E5676_scaffold863G001230 [Cucumis melo var. makuwa]
MAAQEGLTTEDNVKLRLQELEALDENRLEAQQALECYQTRMSKAFDKHVKPCSFQVASMLLRTVARALIASSVIAGVPSKGVNFILELGNF